MGAGECGAIRDALEQDPVGTCMTASRFETAGLDRTRLGGAFWGTQHGRGALCFVGANTMPLAGDARSIGVLGRVLAAQQRHTASIVGRAELSIPLWQALERSWGPAREVRLNQPLLVCPDPPWVRADSRVAAVGLEYLDRYFPAAVAMFTEEVGTDPTAGDGGESYRARVADTLRSGRAFGITDGQTVIFKAEIGALSRRVAVIQGVWVHPAWRGRGIAAPAMASVVRAAQRWGRLPSLYVNAHNLPARAAYARIGFREAGTFASVLF